MGGSDNMTKQNGEDDVNGTTEQVEEALAAGAILPLGTEGAGERAVRMTARAYRHPGLDDRVVVRLVAADLGAAEDQAAGYLGLEPDGEPAEVGLGLRACLGFPEWVLVHYPEDGHHALAVVPELERLARQAKTKPKVALDACHQLAERLSAAVPHFLPTFYEQVGRVFLGVENATYAAQLFSRARKAEAQHGLPLDEDRLEAVLLEFALAGALPVKALSGYAKELALRVPATEALRRFSQLCVRRTAGGLSPSTQMANDLRRLARAAGEDAGAVERAYLADVLTLPATRQASAGWWKAHGPALAALAQERHEIRGVLLNLMPEDSSDELSALWLELMENSGAADGLRQGLLPGLPRPEDGSVGWLGRFLRMAANSWRPPRLPALYALVESMADQLRTELSAAGAALPVPADVDLLDLLLTLDVPVADPEDSAWLRLDWWARGDGQRDLLALAADPRFQQPFHRGANHLGSDREGVRAIRLLADSPGGRPLLADWVRGVAGRPRASGLPELPQALHRLSWLPGEALVLAEDAVREAAAMDLAPLLVRTVRAGLLDELYWPAWEEAVTSMVSAKHVDNLFIADAWPHLVVAGPGQARVIGAEGTVLTHDLRIPANDSWQNPGFHYVDGELLVYWYSRQGAHMRGYWHTAAQRPLNLEATGIRSSRMGWYASETHLTLPLPGGGRTTGHGILHPGDTALPGERAVISDGSSYWVWSHEESDNGSRHDWHEYDPASGECGRRALPGFLADATRDAPAGSTFHSGWLAPVPTTEASPGSPANGLLGWRVVELPNGALRGEDTAGRTVTVPEKSSAPFCALAMPGHERPLAVVRGSHEVSLIDPDGVVTSVARTDGAAGAFAEGTSLLPPLRYWHCLRPRDPRGSAALRRIDRETAVSLLKAATARDGDLPAEVRTLLPEVSHDGLLAGVAGVARHAAEQQALLNKVEARLEEALAGGPAQETASGPADQLLHQALNGLRGSSYAWWYGDDDERKVFEQLQLISRTLAGPARTPLPSMHFEGLMLPDTRLDWIDLLDSCAAIAYRAATAATTDPAHREALHTLLSAFDALGMATGGDAGRWRRFRLFLDEAITHPGGESRQGSWHGILPLADGALLAVTRSQYVSGGHEFTGLYYDPAGRFQVPAPYQVRSSSPVGEPRDEGWLGAFLAEWTDCGPAPWFPAAVEEFARLTGVAESTARMTIAGMPGIDSWQSNFLTAEARTAIGLKAAGATLAKTELKALDLATRRAIVGALLPAEPARLWTHGPDVAAAAEVWNQLVGQRTTVPEGLLIEANKALTSGWAPHQLLPALLDPAGEPQLSRDLSWVITGDRAVPADKSVTGFTGATLTSSIAAIAWLAHRLPAGDAIRAALPNALVAVRERLAHPGLMLDLGRYVNLPAFRKVAGTPTETGEGFERYGAIVLATHDAQPAPALRTALLDAAGSDPYLPALRGDAQQPFPAEVALRVAHDARFAELVADPGDPAAGERGKDGTWWPQDPSRSVPELVVEAAGKYGLGQDAATVYLMLLTLPDPSDRNTARWTGWKPARLKAARAELAASDLVVSATRTRAGRSLFLPGGWTELRAPRLPLEEWKHPLYDLITGQTTPLGLVVPTEPVADLYRTAWQRVREGDAPCFAELKVRRARRR